MEPNEGMIDDTEGPEGSPITALALAEYRLGREAISGEDFSEALVPLLGGCEVCEASIAAYNAYPSTTGSWRCEDCIGDLGYATVQDANLAIFGEENAMTQAYSVFLAYPPDVYDACGPLETYLALVQADTAIHAVGLARAEVLKSLQDDHDDDEAMTYQPKDFRCLLVFEGHAKVCFYTHDDV